MQQSFYPRPAPDHGYLHERYPGITQDRAVELVTQVREQGTAVLEWNGKTFDLTPSRIEGSSAIWARERP